MHYGAIFLADTIPDILTFSPHTAIIALVREIRNPAPAQEEIKNALEKTVCRIPRIPKELLE
jgi:hypothetical protein